MFCIVNLLKALACLLIFNFHSEIVFPSHLSILAFGGDLGNNIFFLISGFTIWPSVERNAPGKAWSWYKKRFLRITPMVIAFYIAELVSGGTIVSSVKDVVCLFVFPTMYWFTGAILIFYAVFYAVEKKLAPGGRVFLAAVLVVGHLAFDGIYVERYVIGYLAMMVGCELRREMAKFNQGNHGMHLLAGAAVASVVYVVLKLMRARNLEFLGLVHLGIGLATIVIATLLSVWGIENEKHLSSFFAKHTVAWKTIEMISKITMAVYLSTSFCDWLIMKTVISVVPFPLSYAVNMLVSFVVAYGISGADELLQKKINRG